MKEASLPAPPPQSPKSGLALSSLMVDFRVHILLTNHQNYKLGFTCVMKHVLAQAQLLPPKKPALLVRCQGDHLIYKSKITNWFWQVQVLL